MELDGSKRCLLLQSHALLSALRKNLCREQSFLIDEKYIKQYNEILAEIERSGLALPRFKIPDEEVKNYPSSANLGGKVRYKEYKEVEASLFFSKLDGLLVFLQFMTLPPKQDVGFRDNE